MGSLEWQLSFKILLLPRDKFLLKDESGKKLLANYLCSLKGNNNLKKKKEKTTPPNVSKVENTCS